VYWFYNDVYNIYNICVTSIHLQQKKNDKIFKFESELWSCLHFRDQKEKMISTF